MNAWSVAGAILLLNGSRMHIGQLTRRVIDTDLTDLTKRGGRTPEKTLASDLSNNHSDIFSHVDGTFNVSEHAALSCPAIRRALLSIYDLHAAEYRELVATFTTEGSAYSSTPTNQVRYRFAAIGAAMQRFSHILAPVLGQYSHGTAGLVGHTLNTINA